LEGKGSFRQLKNKASALVSRERVVEHYGTCRTKTIV